MAVTSIANQIRVGQIEIGLAVGTESMTAKYGAFVRFERISLNPSLNISARTQERPISAKKYSLTRLQETVLAYAAFIFTTAKSVFLNIDLCAPLLCSQWAGPERMSLSISQSREKIWTISQLCKYSPHLHSITPLATSLQTIPKDPNSEPTTLNNKATSTKKSSP